MRGEDLMKAAKQLGIQKGLARKAEVIQWLATYIDIHLPEAVKLCSEVERQALAEAAYGGGILEPGMFWGKYGVSCPTPKNYYSYRETPSPFDLLVRPDALGTLSVTDAVAEGLRHLLPEPKVVEVKAEGDEVPATHATRPIQRYSGERIVFHELRRILGLAQVGKLAVTAKRTTPTDACVGRIGEALMLPDLDLETQEEQRNQWFKDPEAGPVRAYAWGVVVQQCGWCKATGSKLSLTRKGQAMLAVGTVEALKEGVKRLLGDDTFDEFNRINHIRGQTGNGKRSLTRPSSRRQSIAASMREWPTGRWIAFEDAFRHSWASGNTFEVSRNPWDLYFCEKQYGSLGYANSGRGGDLERQYLRAFLVETLATLGMVDIAYVYPHHLWPEFKECWGIDDLGFCSRYDGLSHVRLTNLGAYCLGSTNSYEMPVEKSAGLVKVLPTMELILVNDAVCSPVDAARLELFASPKNERIWRIDPKRILAYIETGGSMDDIRRGLESVADGDIPETLHTLLDEMAKKTTALKGGQPCRLIEVGDAVTAALIAHDPDAGKFCLLAGDRHLAVVTKNERAFRTAVKKLGYVLPQ